MLLSSLKWAEPNSHFIAFWMKSRSRRKKNLENIRTYDLFLLLALVLWVLSPFLWFAWYICLNPGSNILSNQRAHIAPQGTLHMYGVPCGAMCALWFRSIFNIIIATPKAWALLAWPPQHITWKSFVQIQYVGSKAGLKSSLVQLGWNLSLISEMFEKFVLPSLFFDFWFKPSKNDEKTNKTNTLLAKWAKT